MRRMGHSKISGGNRPSRICRHVQGRMALFLDGELSAREAQDVARHIAGCTSCRREQEQWRQAEQSLAGAKRQIPSAGDLRAGFYARLADVPTARHPQSRINWRLAVPALAACGLAIGWLTTSRPPVSPQTGQVAAVSRPGQERQIAQARDSVPEDWFYNGERGDRTPAGAGLLPGASNHKAIKDGVAKASPTTGYHPRPPIRSQFKRRVPSQIVLLDTVKSRHERGGETRLRSRAASMPLASISSATAAPFMDAKRQAKSNLAFGANRAWNLPDTNSLAEASRPVGALQKNKTAPQAVRDSRLDANRQDYAEALSSAGAGAAKPEPLSKPSGKDLSASSLSSFAASLDRSLDKKTQDNYALRLMDASGRDFALMYESERFGRPSGNEGLDLQVRDTKRGFTSGTRLAGQMQEQDGRRVLVIEADDAEPSAPSLPEQGEE